MSEEDVLPHLMRWKADVRKAALVTLIGVEGGAPREPGAQMAVCEDGAYVGYLSGGCLEQAVALEAQDVLRIGQPRLVRYGKGSPYFDVKLPCGSGLDIYFDPMLPRECVADMLARRTARRAFALRTSLPTGESAIEDVTAEGAVGKSGRSGDAFRRVYVPSLRLLLLGGGPMLVAAAALAATTGIEVAVTTGDDSTKAALARAGLGNLFGDGGGDAGIERLDFASAAILFFHDHVQEPDLLARLLTTRCFYIGALGNHAVHRDRLAIMSNRGFEPSALARIHAPVGSIAGAKSAATLAVGALAALLAEAKSKNLIS
ncbi:MAG: XdhC family protein [Hyphomicrobium sp.]